MGFQRVSADDVQGIFATTLDLQPFITTASLIVSQRLVGVYNDATLREIELWLSAHLACTSSGGGSGSGTGPISSVRADEISITYAVGKLGDGLSSSRYGDAVKALDYLGILAQATKAIPAKFSVH